MTVAVDNPRVPGGGTDTGVVLGFHEVEQLQPSTSTRFVGPGGAKSMDAGVVLGVLVDVHTRLERCGVAPGEPAVSLARQAHEAEVRLRLSSTVGEAEVFAQAGI